MQQAPSAWFSPKPFKTLINGIEKQHHIRDQADSRLHLLHCPLGQKPDLPARCGRALRLLRNRPAHPSAGSPPSIVRRRGDNKALLKIMGGGQTRGLRPACQAGRIADEAGLRIQQQAQIIARLVPRPPEGNLHTAYRTTPRRTAPPGQDSSPSDAAFDTPSRGS